MDLVKIISNEIDNLQRRVMKFTRYGRDDVQTSINAMAFGLDSAAPKDLIAVYSQTNEKGKTVILGYLNTKQVVTNGETRIYSTDSEGNDISFDIVLRTDDTAEIGGDTDNMVRYSVLKAEYDKTKDTLDTILNILNGAPIPEPGNGAPSALQQALAGALVGKQTGDISGSKIDEIKTI